MQLSVPLSSNLSDEGGANESRSENLVDVAIANSTRQIALETRRDSASMKTIAIVTLIFLPRTFISVRVFCSSAK